MESEGPTRCPPECRRSLRSRLSPGGNTDDYVVGLVLAFDNQRNEKRGEGRGIVVLAGVTKWPKLLSGNGLRTRERELGLLVLERATAARRPPS